jgi:ABC-type antimicrobial peptide transport system permease subunit
MSTIGFPLKDLRRRKTQTVLSVVSLTLCVASMVSTVLIAQNSGLQIAGILTGKLNVGFTNIFSGFATVITYLSILTGGVMTYFFVSANMSSRMRDIAVIKAIGCISDQAFGYFATQLFLLVSLSCVFGTGIGVILSIFYSYLNAGILPASQMLINGWTIVEILIVFALVSLFLGIRPVVKAMQIKPVEALFPYYLREVSFKSAQSSFRRLGVSFRIAYRAFMRRKTRTLSTIICLSFALASATIAVVGSAIANNTTQTYLNKGIGANIILIGQKDITTQYMYFLSQPFQTENKAIINYSDSKYVIPQYVLTRLTTIPDVEVDPRLFFEASVVELQTIQVVEGQYYVVIGDHRSSDAVIFGVNPQLVVNGMVVDGRTLNETDNYAAILGDSLASRILTSPLDQKVAILGKDFAVVGVALDPLNAGFVAYLPLNVLMSNSNETRYNLVLLKINPHASSETLKKISEALNGTELQMVELNPILDRYQSFFQSVWSSFTVISLFFSITMILCLFTYMTLHITEQEPEIAIMRALGAKRKKVVATIMMQAALIILVSGIIGISTGLYVLFVFLIPTPTISQVSLLVAGGWLLLTVSLLLVSGLYSAVQIAMKPLSHIMPKG